MNHEENWSLPVVETSYGVVQCMKLKGVTFAYAGFCVKNT